MKNKVLFYPTNLDIVKVIEDDVELTNKQKQQGIKYYQRVLYPISRVISEYRFNKSFKDEKIEEVFINLNIELIRKIFGSKRFYWIMPFLIRNKILIKDNKYYPGTKSYGYRLNQKYINKHYYIEKVNLNTDKTLYNNLMKSIDLNNEYINNVYQVLSKIKINGPKAIDLLNKKMGENIINNNNNNSYIYSPLMLPPFSNDWINRRFIEEYFNSIIDLNLLDGEEEKIEVFNNWMVNITKIIEEDFFIKKSHNSGRIFTNITSLPKELRVCLYFENPNEGELCDIDMANSQPFLFNKFLLDNYNMDDDLFGDKYEDIRLYIKLTSKGELYEYLMKEFGLSNRDLFKKDFFGSIFYCRTNSNFRNYNSKRFGELFPNVMKLVLKMKEGNYKNLSIQLQKFEVDIIINNVSKKLFKEGVRHFTIHDSIMCDEENKPLTIALIKSALKEYNMQGKIKS